MSSLAQPSKNNLPLLQGRQGPKHSRHPSQLDKGFHRPKGPRSDTAAQALRQAGRRVYWLGSQRPEKHPSQSHSVFLLFSSFKTFPKYRRGWGFPNGLLKGITLRQELSLCKYINRHTKYICNTMQKAWILLNVARLL